MRNLFFLCEVCECPTRKNTAPVLDFIRALELKIEEARSEDANDNKAKDDNAERNDGLVSDSVDRFDAKVLIQF